MQEQLSYIRRIKQRFFLSTLILLILTGFIISSYNYKTILSEEKNTLNIQRTNIYNSYNYLLRNLENDLVMHSKMVLDSSELQRAVSEQDNTKIYRYVHLAYERMREDNPFLEIMTFRSADGTVLMRIHRPKMLGDTLHPSRKLIIQTNSDHQIHTGFEVGKLKMAYRAITPIFYKDTYVGSLELGVDPHFIIQSLKHIADLKYGLLIKNLEETASLDKRALLKMGEFEFVQGDMLFTHMRSQIDLNKDHVKLEYDKRTYSIDSDLNILSLKGDLLGKLLIAYDIHKLTKRTNRHLRESFIFIFFTIVLLGFIINAGFNFLLNRLIMAYNELQEFNRTLAEKVQSEIEKNRTQEKHMLHQSRLAQMGELLSMIAHQWRQPLATINTIISSIKLTYALEDYDLNNKEDQDKLLNFTNTNLDKIEDCAMSLSQTIDDFKSFYKPSKGKSAATLEDAAEKALSIIIPSFKSHQIAVHTEFPQTPKVNIYFNELVQVILNLLQNAMEELQDHKIEEPEVSIRTYHDEHNVCIEVCDNGKGIDASLCDKIFDPYFSTKEEKNGSGLGLYMSKMIIHKHHHGKFYLNGQSNKTCFVISLPREEQHGSASA